MLLREFIYWSLYAWVIDWALLWIYQELKASFLLHLGMDGPSVNNAFQQKLFDELHEKEDTSFLNLWTCCLHKVHNTCQTALKKIEIWLWSVCCGHSFFFQTFKCKMRRLHQNGRDLISINISSALYF